MVTEPKLRKAGFIDLWCYPLSMGEALAGISGPEAFGPENRKAPQLAGR